MCAGWWPGSCTDAPTPPPASAVRDHADVSALLPKDASAHTFSAALMELGRHGVHRADAAVWAVPAQRVPVAAGRLPARRKVRLVGPQGYAGTDRQVRGRLMDVLRDSEFPVTRAQLDVAWLTRHRAARPGAGLAACRRAGGQDQRRAIRSGRRRGLARSQKRLHRLPIHLRRLVVNQMAGIGHM